MDFSEITSDVTSEPVISESEIETDVTEVTETTTSFQYVDYSQHFDKIEEGLQLIAGLLLFFFVWSIFHWLYNFFKSFF